MLDSGSLRESLLLLPESLRLQAIQSLSDDEAEALLFDWPLWARPNQLTPAGDWFLWIIMAGRGYGKTRAGAEFTIGEAMELPGSFGALVAETPAQARDVMIEGESGILACSSPHFMPDYEPSKRRLTWPNGTRASIFSAYEYEELRGPQHNWAWCDEMAKWRYPREAWDNLALGLRLPPRARVCATTTPRPIPLLKELMKADTTVVTRGTTYENLHNLSAQFKKQVLGKYEGTRQGRQELKAEMLEDLEGALWSHDMLDALRVADVHTDSLQRIVVAVDPSGSKDASDEGDEQGIAVAGMFTDGEKTHGRVLADRSCRLSPAGWGKRAVQAAIDWKADCIVGETNYGGAMVEHVVQTAAKELGVTVRFQMVTASRGKHVRAEPISALYEQKRVKHVGTFAQLEDELCLFTPLGWEGEGSPNRADAAVWALTELMVSPAAPSYDGLEGTTSSWRRRR
jgi:phage terminase large subunit-like protein